MESCSAEAAGESPCTASLQTLLVFASVHCLHAAGLVSEQRAHVALLVEQRRLLRAAGGSLVAALQQLNEQPQLWRLPAPAAHACVVNLQALALQDRVSSV